MARRKFNSLLTLLLTVWLTLMGSTACKSLKISKSQTERQQRAYLDSIRKADSLMARENFIRDSIYRVRRAYEEYVKDSIARSHKSIYGGPSMMDRRFKEKDK